MGRHGCGTIGCVPFPAAAARPLGLALGVLADAALGDPARHHPVAGFGTAVGALERRLYTDRVLPGAVLVAVAVAVPVGVGAALERSGARRPWLRVASTAVATWTVLGGTSLAREGVLMARALEAGDLEAARARLPHLCARDPSGLGGDALARATVESLAENASDAVVAPLLWGAVAGVPGLLGYRAVNTLDAMIGYRSARYLRFGRAAARLDDVANLVPARVTAVLVAVAAPSVGGSPTHALRVAVRDGGLHPSPNAGRPEAAVAGALGVRLGGENTYHGRLERRPGMGEGGRAPQAGDVRRAVRLGRVVGAGAAVLAVALASTCGRSRRRAAAAP